MLQSSLVPRSGPGAQIWAGSGPSFARRATAADDDIIDVNCGRRRQPLRACIANVRDNAWLSAIPAPACGGQTETCSAQSRETRERDTR